MKRICLVLPSLSVGGMERVMIELSSHIYTQKQDQVFFVLLTKSKWFYSPLKGVDVYEPDFTYKKQNKIFFALKTALYFRRIIRSLNPQVILSFGEYWNSFVLLSLLGLKFQVYVSDRCNPSKSLGFLHDSLRKILYPRARGVIAQTAKAKKIFYNLKLNSHIIIIGNPVRLIDKQGEKKEKIILSVGRLIKSKNMDRLIEIFERINDPSWQLVIVGGDIKGGTNLEKLRKKSEELKSYKRINLVGPIQNIDEYYYKSSIFAFMSVSEGFPNVIGEAMSAGLPVVSYDCMAGPSDLIQDGVSGFLIREGDEKTFEMRLRELMNDDEKRLKFGNNSKKIINRFSVPDISEQFYKVLTESL